MVSLVASASVYEPNVRSPFTAISIAIISSLTIGFSMASQCVILVEHGGDPLIWASSPWQLALGPLTTGCSALTLLSLSLADDNNFFRCIYRTALLRSSHHSPAARRCRQGQRRVDYIGTILPRFYREPSSNSAPGRPDNALKCSCSHDTGRHKLPSLTSALTPLRT